MRVTGTWRKNLSASSYHPKHKAPPGKCETGSTLKVTTVTAKPKPSFIPDEIGSTPTPATKQKKRLVLSGISIYFSLYCSTQHV